MKTTSGASFNRAKSFQAYGTPPEFMEAVKHKFVVSRFDWDLAADAQNAKAPEYFSIATNSLLHDWARECAGWCWLNPPFADIAPWAEKCAASLGPEPSSCSLFPIRRIFLLVPAAVGSNWFATHVAGRSRVYFLNGRICFDGKGPYPKDCLLAVYGEQPGYEVWRWKK